MRFIGNIVFYIYMCGPFIEIYENSLLTKSRIWGQWTGATVSHLQGSLSPIAHTIWLEKWSKNKLIMRSHSDGSPPNRRRRIFVMEESNLGSYPPPSINLLEVATPMEFRPGLNKNLCLGVAEKSRKAGPFMPRNLRIYRCDKIKDKFKRWVIKN